MSSDSSVDENLDLLREATDFQFINDSMFNEKTSNSVIKETIPSSKDTLPSLRKANDEDDQFNLFRVTPEFQNFVAKHLSKLLEEKIKGLLKSGKNTNIKPKRIKSGIRLFSTSKNFLRVDKNSDLINFKNQAKSTVIFNKSHKLVSKYREVDKEILREVAVNPDDIISKKDIRYWSNRSKAPIFHYKKSTNGSLVLVEPEFK